MNPPLPDIGLIGLAQSGKDTVASLFIQEDARFSRVAFADPVREMLLRLNPLVEVPEEVKDGFIWERTISHAFVAEVVGLYGWDLAKRWPDVRRLLQRMGTEAVRSVAPEFWVDLAMRTADLQERTIFTDCRFVNEARAIYRRGGVIVRVVRPGAADLVDGSAQAHASEKLALSLPADFTVSNDGSLQDLAAQVRHLLTEVDLTPTLRPF